VIRSRIVRWVGHVARMVAKHAYRVRWGRLKETVHSEDVEIEGTNNIKIDQETEMSYRPD